MQITEHGDMNTATPTPSSRARRPLAVAAWLLGAAGAYFLLTRHFDPVFPALPYLLLLACPLMHLFGRHRRGARHGQPPSARDL